MGELKKIFILLLLTAFLQVHSQSDTLLHLKKSTVIEGNFADFYVDNLSDIYFISFTNQIKKITLQGDSVVFNDVKRYGTIYSVDVSNALKVLVYYKDFQTIITLDHFFNVVNTIDLRQIGILQAKAIARSYDNNIWVYDEFAGKLKKIDDNGRTIFESTDFRLLFSDPLNIIRIIDDNTRLYLYDANSGWLVFDYYGAFQKKIPGTNLKDVQIKDNTLTGRDSTYIYYINVLLPQEKKMNPGINLSACIKLQQQSGNFYMLTTRGLYIYRMNTSHE